MDIFSIVFCPLFTDLPPVPKEIDLRALSETPTYMKPWHVPVVISSTPAVLMPSGSMLGSLALQGLPSSKEKHQERLYCSVSLESTLLRYHGPCFWILGHTTMANGLQGIALTLVEEY